MVLGVTKFFNESRYNLRHFNPHNKHQPIARNNTFSLNLRLLSVYLANVHRSKLFETAISLCSIVSTSYISLSHSALENLCNRGDYPFRRRLSREKTYYTTLAREKNECLVVYLHLQPKPSLHTLTHQIVISIL